MMQMNAGGHPLSIVAIKWTILQQGVREPTGVAIPARGTRAIPGVVSAPGTYVDTTTTLSGKSGDITLTSMKKIESV